MKNLEMILHNLLSFDVTNGYFYYRFFFILKLKEFIADYLIFDYLIIQSVYLILIPNLNNNILIM